MQRKYVIWSLVAAMLVSTLYLAAGSFGIVFAAGGQNLTTGKIVTASGQSQTYTPDNVKDSNPGTYWESANSSFPQWIQVDLGTSTSIDQVVLKLPPAWETRTQTLSVQGSTDGALFSTLAGSAAYVFNPDTGNTATVNFTAASTRYVRISVTANTGWPAAQFSEVEIYGATGATPTPAPTATPAAGTYQAEAAALSGGAKVNTDHTGFSGTGFVDGYWTQGAATAFTVNVQAAGTRNVTLRYGNGNASPQTLSLYVNGAKIRQTSLPNLPNWDTWGTKTEALNLNAGNNIITYKFDAGDSANVNLDQITVADTATATPTPTPVVTPIVTPAPTATSAPTATPTPVPTQTVMPSPTIAPTSPPGSNIAIGKDITASSATQNFTASNAIDNNTATYWEGGSNPSNLTLDFGANQNITSIVLKLNPAAEWGTRTQTIQVLGHNQTATAFSNLVAAQTYTFNPATGNTVTIPVTATVKRLQLNITANSGAPAGQIAEFQVYGSPAANPDLTITGMSWTPAAPDEASAVTLNAVVKKSAILHLQRPW